jgi:hypothetical protein
MTVLSYFHSSILTTGKVYFDKTKKNVANNISTYHGSHGANVLKATNGALGYSVRADAVAAAAAPDAGMGS